MSDLAEEASHPRYMGSPYVREAVEDWLAYIGTERQLAAKTAEAYERDVSQFLAFLAVHFNRLPDMPQLLALQARDVRAFLAARRGEGVGSRSLSRTLSALRMFYKFLERRGYGKNDAIRAVALPKLPHSVPKPLTAPKATALVDGADIAAADQPEWIVPPAKEQRSLDSGDYKHRGVFCEEEKGEPQSAVFGVKPGDQFGFRFRKIKRRPLI